MTEKGEMRIEIEVQPWIMQDGSYGDFAVGDEEWFAVEFFGALVLRGTRARAAKRRI